MACPPDGDPLVEGQGSCEGLITTAPAGRGGFGYDPVFWVNELDRTMAQISSTQKNQISHRGQAIEALRQPLLATFPELAKASCASTSPLDLKAGEFSLPLTSLDPSLATRHLTFDWSSPV